MKIFLKKLLIITFQLLLIMVPLTWTATTSELFEFPKMLVTYVGAILITSIWLMRMVFEKKILFKKTPLQLPILLFLGSQTLSTIISINTHTSLFGYYSRFNGGLLSLISYISLYFAAVSNFDLKDTKKIIKTLIIAAFLSALYAFPEHFGHSPSCQMISGTFDAKCWVQDVQSRVFGTFGQPNWLAAYLSTIVPITIFLAVYTKRTTDRLIAVALAALSLATILFTKSQSGIGATAIAIGLSFIFIAIQKKKKVLLLGLIPLFAVIYMTKQATVIKTLNSLNSINPFHSTTANLVAKDNATRIGGTDSMVIRRIVWTGAWELAKRNPILGTGVETFAYAYYNVRPVEHNLVSEWDFLYNKAHNEFLNYAATTGFLGLGTYLFFLGSYIWWSLKKEDTQVDTGTPLRYAFVSGFIALCVSNFFGFSTVPVNTLLFLFPALAFLLTSAQKPSENKHSIKASPLSISQSMYLGLIGIISLVLLISVNQMFQADKLYARGKSARNAQDYQKAVTYLQQAMQSSPNEAVYTDELSLVASEIAQNLHQSNQVPQASEAARIAIELSEKTLNLNRVHLNFYKTRAKVFINLTEINPQYVLESAATLDRAISLAPTDAKLWFNRALLSQQIGKNQEAQDLYRHTLELKPNYDLARLQYERLADSSSE